MTSRNTITFTMLGLFALAAGSASAHAFGGSLSDPMNLLSDPHPQWDVDEFGGDIPSLYNPFNPGNPTLVPKDVGHTDQGPVGRPTGGSGGGIAPVMSAPPSTPTTPMSSSDLADLLGQLDTVILAGADQPLTFTPSDTALLPELGGDFSGESTFAAQTPSLAIPAPGAIVLIGLAGAMAGVRRRR